MELIPKAREEFQEENSDIDLSTLKFSPNEKGFHWSNQNQQEEVLLLCGYYVKKKKSKKLLRLSSA